jgi:hypothetical protein
MTGFNCATFIFVQVLTTTMVPTTTGTTKVSSRAIKTAGLRVGRTATDGGAAGAEEAADRIGTRIIEDQDIVGKNRPRH